MSRWIGLDTLNRYQNGKKLSGVIYMHRISDIRMSGISTRNFKMFRQLCGDSTLKNVVIVTNMWGQVSKEVGEAREAELKEEEMFFKPVLDKGAVMLRHNENTKYSAQNVVRCIMDNHPLSLRIQRELVDEKKDISQTGAGEDVDGELMVQTRKHRQEMRELQEEMRGGISWVTMHEFSLTVLHFSEALRVKDEVMKRELEVKARKLQEEMNRHRSEAQGRASEHSEGRQRLERHMQELIEGSHRAAERARNEHVCRMSELQRRLEKMASESQKTRADLLRQVEELRASRDQGCICM